MHVLLKQELFKQLFLLGRTMFLKCPLTVPSYLWFYFVLYCKVGVMINGKDKTNRGTHCGKSHSKDQRANSAMAAKIRTTVGGSSTWCPENHMSHPIIGHTWGTDPLSCSEGLPARNLLSTFPYPLTAFDLNSTVLVVCLINDLSLRDNI
jgi:hypothetical protein